MTEPSTDEREDFTDIVLSIDGHHGLDDPMVMRALDPAISRIEKLLGCDVVISSHHSNNAGETFRTVSDERDQLRQALAARPAVDVEGIARVLAGHEWWPISGTCRCGWTGMWFAAHQAAAVVAYFTGGDRS